MEATATRDMAASFSVEQQVGVQWVGIMGKEKTTAVMR